MGSYSTGGGSGASSVGANTSAYNFVPANNAVVGKGGLLSGTGGYAAPFTRWERRSQMILGGQPIKSLRFVYWNGYVMQGEHANANPITIECGLENPANTKTVMFTFGGNPTVTVAAGAWVVSDAIFPAAFGLNVFPAGWAPIARTGIILSATGQFLTFQQNIIQAPPNAGAGIWAVASNSVTSQIQNTGALVTPSGGQNNTNNGAVSVAASGPTVILGEWAGTPDISAGISGDSIAEGFQDNQDTGSGNGGGYIVRSLQSVNGRTVAQVQTARSNESAFNWTQGTGPLFRTWLFQFLTHYIDEIGTNDIFFGQTAAQTLASKQVIWSAARANMKNGGHIANIAFIPRTSSTDNWATTANQTPLTGFTTGAARDQVNASISGLVGQANGPDEQISVNAGYLQDSSITQDWAVNGTANYLTPDGTHPGPVGAANAAVGVNGSARYWSLPSNGATDSVSVYNTPAASPAQLTAAQSGGVYSNTGATAEVYYKLPASSIGLSYSFYVDASVGIRVNAQTGDNIRNAATLSASGGYVESLTVGNFITLTCVKANLWAVSDIVGNWTTT